MINKLVIAGGSGFLGNVLSSYFSPLAKEIVILSRKKSLGYRNIRTVFWDAKTLGSWMDELNGCDVLINLTGKSVNCRYTEKNKREILQSRLGSTSILGQAIQSLATPPKLWLQAGSSTIYNHSHQPNAEDSSNIGSDFSTTVCQEWEKAFRSQQLTQTKRILMRVAIVLGKDGGAFPPLKRLVQLGFGGKQGDGTQKISWVHENDFARVVHWLTDNGQEKEIYNICSPEVVSNDQFMKALRARLNIPFGVPSPEWLLKIGAKMIGTETELILKSRFVEPRNLLHADFKFELGNLKEAFKQLSV